ncbi:MAG: phage major capsid protein, partial [Clostridia bacterium]|nr:phage major capsid protein [Clostridia bacterium]
LTYSVKKYGGIIQVTDELFQDSTANIQREIAMHLALCREDTINAKILSILQAKTETALSGGIGSIRTALIRTLGGAYTPTTKLYTNDDGYAYLVNLQDNNNRDYFFYDPRNGAQPAINLGGRVIPVVQVPNSVLASTAAASNKTKMPFIMGDLHEAVTIFDRRQMSVDASNSATITYTEGTGENAVTHSVSAFQNGMTFLRAYLRADFKAVDLAAWINGSITA